MTYRRLKANHQLLREQPGCRPERRLGAAAVQQLKTRRIDHPGAPGVRPVELNGSRSGASKHKSEGHNQPINYSPERPDSTVEHGQGKQHAGEAGRRGKPGKQRGSWSEGWGWGGEGGQRRWAGTLTHRSRSRRDAPDRDKLRPAANHPSTGTTGHATANRQLWACAHGTRGCQLRCAAREHLLEKTTAVCAASVAKFLGIPLVFGALKIYRRY